MAKDSISKADFQRNLLKKYSKVPENENERLMEILMGLVQSDWGDRDSSDAFLNNVVNTLQRKFQFKTVAIGLRDKKDGKFRYRIIKGFSDSARQNLAKMEYSYDDMLDDGKYPGIKISKTIEFSSVIDEPEAELFTFSQPSKIKEPRKSLNEFKEGDYFHIYLYGEKNTLVGWIECGHKPNNELPSRNDFKWLELFCAIISQIIWEKIYSQ